MFQQFDQSYQLGDISYLIPFDWGGGGLKFDVFYFHRQSVLVFISVSFLLILLNCMIWHLDLQTYFKLYILALFFERF
jgi:hypothetical protein